MLSFYEFEERAYLRHGGQEKVELQLVEPKSRAELALIADERWLSAFSKIVFQSGFNWRVIENKWADFESTFGNFNLNYCAYLSDEALEALMQEGRVVKHWAKIKSIRENAMFLRQISEQNESLGSYFAAWESSDFVGNVQLLKREGSRLGGRVGQVALRRMGVDTFVLSADVLGALAQAGSINKMPSSQKAWRLLQETIDFWQDESAYSLNRLSQILGLSFGDIY